MTSTRNGRQKSVFLADVWCTLCKLRVFRHWRKSRAIARHCVNVRRRRVLRMLRAHAEHRAFKADVVMRKQMQVCMFNPGFNTINP